VKNVKTPTLLIHGERDNDVTISEAEQMYTALRCGGAELKQSFSGTLAKATACANLYIVWTRSPAYSPGLIAICSTESGGTFFWTSALR